MATNGEWAVMKKELHSGSPVKEIQQLLTLSWYLSAARVET